jgi:hypothetical protein
MECVMSRQLHRVQIADEARTGSLLSGMKIDEQVVRILCSASMIGRHGSGQAGSRPDGFAGQARAAPPRTTVVNSGLRRPSTLSLVRPHLVIPSSWGGGRSSTWRLRGRLWLKD